MTETKTLSVQAVMVGGVVSALIVGAILDKGDLYANVAAESYLQSEDDEEFWKALSEEEKKKAKDIMEKIKQSKSDGPLSSPVQASVEEVATPETETKKDAPKAPDAAATASKPTDMFSDYSD